MGVAVVYRVRGTGVGSYPDMGAGGIGMENGNETLGKLKFMAQALGE